LNNDVKQCVDARLNVFTQYYEVPPALQNEVDQFSADITVLANQSADAAAFEAAFAANGMQERFNSILPRLTPKAYTPTAQDKATSKQVLKDMIKEDKDDIVKYAAKDVADSAMVKAESELIAAGRKAMIEEGTFGTYTKVTNAVEDAQILTGLFRKKFGKKK